MILTGKCKEDFGDQSLYDYEQFMSISETLQYALIIEWFDSLSMVIDIDVVRVDTMTFTAYIYHDNHRSKSGRTQSTISNLNTRQEATKQAIIKANEIYNSI